MSTKRKEILPADWDHRDRWDRRRQYYTSDFYVLPLGDWDVLDSAGCRFDRHRICGDLDEAMELAQEMIDAGYAFVEIINEHGIMHWVWNRDSDDPHLHYKEWGVLDYESGGRWRYDGKDLAVLQEDPLPPLPRKDRRGLIAFPNGSQ